MKKLMLLGRLLMVVLIVTSCGCAAALSELQAACVAAVPVFGQIQTYASDAEVAVDQAAAVEQLLPPDAAAALTVAVDAARVALRVVIAGSNAAIKLCNSPDLATAFAEFEKAWSSVEQALASATTAGKLKMAKPIQPPLIVVLLRHQTAG